MSAENGGRATPPVPPPQQQQQQREVPILTEIIQQVQATSAERTDDGAIVTFVVVESGQPIRRAFLIGPTGKKHILEELSGGIALP